MNTLRYFLVWCALSFVCMLHADELTDIRFAHIGLEEGLSHSTVQDISQDGEGNLWFATHDGLNKYDGYHFTVYRHRYNRPQSIACDIIRCLARDAQGRMWIGTDDGLSLYHDEEGCFKNFCDIGHRHRVGVVSIAPITGDSLLVGTKNGVWWFDGSRGCFLADSLSTDLSRLKSAVIILQGTSVFIGAEGVVYQYSWTDGDLHTLVQLPQNVKINKLISGASNQLWIATEGDGLYRYDRKTNELFGYHQEDKEGGLNSNYVRSLAFDSENRLWVGTYSGLHIYDETGQRFYSINDSLNQEGALSQNSVRSIFQDSQGGMWLGTYWGGLNYYHPLCNRFQHIRHRTFCNSLSDNVVNCIVEDQAHNLWIGTSDGGLDYYDSATKKYRNYLFDPGTSEGVPFKDVKTVYVDEAANLVYVGTHAGGLMVLNRKTGNKAFYNTRNGYLFSNHIYSIIPDGEKGLWMASLDYLIYYDKAAKRFIPVDKEVNGQPIQRHNRLLFRDSQYRIWMGGKGGVSVYTQQGTDLMKNNDFPIDSLLKEAFVNCIYESSEGVVWVGTRSGLFALRQGAAEAEWYTVDNGLPSNVICSILEDAAGKLWISSNQGLSCMTVKTQEIRNYTWEDGLQSNQFNVGASCISKKGTMLFGGVNGITLFRPEALVNNSFTPTPVINKLFVFNKEILPQDESGILEKTVWHTRQITLQSFQNSFSLSFVVSNYIAGKHNTFAYKLEGYSDDWYVQNDISPVSYANLPAGQYRFLLKAANNDGKWCDDMAELYIRVLPVWYCTWWAISLFVFTGLGFVFLVVRFFWIRKNMQTEIRMERLDKEKQEEISQLKIRFYVNISHELRTPLSLIIAPLEDLLKSVKGHWEREKLLYIQRNATRLLHLVNQMMDYRRAELGIFELNPSYSNAYQRVMSLFVNYEVVAKRKNMDYDLYSEVQDEDMLFDSTYLDLIVNNLLSNAFKFTEDGDSIWVKLYKEDNFLVLQIADTGVGIPEEKQKKIFERFYQVEDGHTGSGIGLSLVQRLVELHHGKLTLQSEVGKGSTFTVYLPQDCSAYSEKELAHCRGDQKESRVYSTNAQDVYVETAEVESAEAGGEDSMESCGKQKGETVLIVEDNEELRSYLAANLGVDYHLLQAANGKKALELIKDNQVDLVLSDVMMPEMDGVTLCRLLKQNIETCHIPVFLLSAKVDIKYQLQGLQVGADDYLSKPFSMEVIMAKISNALQTRQRMENHSTHYIQMNPEKVTSNAMDEEILRKAIAIVEKNMGNADFSTEQFASEMNMSRSNLHLKLKAITGKSAIDFIHKIRFEHACKLLKEGKYTVSEISFMIGYNTPSYFAARFKKYMGCLPSEYGKE